MATGKAQENTIAVIPPIHIPKVLATQHEAVKRKVMTKIIEIVRNAVIGQLELPMFRKKQEIDPIEVHDLEVEQSNFDNVADALDEALRYYNLEVVRTDDKDVIKFQEPERQGVWEQTGKRESFSEQANGV